MISNHLALDWLLEDECWWLWAPETKRESIRLLVALAPKLSGTMQAKLMRVILDGPPSEMLKNVIEPERRKLISDREIWLRLSKLSRAKMKLNKRAKKKLDEISKNYPEWQLSVDERDEFPFWTSDGSEVPKSIAVPRHRSELIEWLKQNPGTDGWQKDDWQQYCQENLDTASEALCVLSGEGYWLCARWREALLAWPEGEPLHASWKKNASTLVNAPDDVLQDLAHDLGRWLRSIAKTFKGGEMHFFTLINRILNLEYENVIREGNSVFNAINHPVGFATEALLNWWHRLPLKDGQRLPKKLIPIFTELCDTNIEKYCHSRVWLSAHVITFFRVDPDWTTSHLLPLFNWNLSVNEACSAWEGFLWSPRLYIPLLDVLKDDFLGIANHYSKLSVQHARQYAAFLTYTALDPGDTFTDFELAEATNALGPEGLNRAAQALVTALESSGERAANYWTNRIMRYLETVWPKEIEKITSDISENLARLCIAADEKFPDAFDFLRHWLIPITEKNAYSVHALRESKLCRVYPDETLSFLEHIVGKDVPLIAVGRLKDCLVVIVETDPQLKNDPRYKRLVNLVP